MPYPTRAELAARLKKLEEDREFIKYQLEALEKEITHLKQELSNVSAALKQPKPESE